MTAKLGFAFIMNKKRLVPAWKKKFNYLKPLEVPGWRKMNGDKADFSVDSKLPSILNDRGDYYRNLIYPHWTLQPLTSDSVKNSTSTTKKPSTLCVLQGKQGLLDYEAQKDFERIPGKNITIGSLTCREPCNSVQPFKIILQDTPKTYRIKKLNQRKPDLTKKSLNFYQFPLSTNQDTTICESKNIETETIDNATRENHAEENELFVEMLNSSTSRTASAVVFGSKKTLLDVFTSALHSGSAKNAEEAKMLVKETLGKGVLVKSAQKMKLILKNYEKNLNDCSVSSIFKENEESLNSPALAPINNRRNSLNHPSDAGHSSAMSKDDQFESVSTNITYSNRKSQESIRSQVSVKKSPKNEIRIIKQVFRAKDKSPNVTKNLKNEAKKENDFKIRIKELAGIEILESDDPLLKFRSKSVTNHFEIRSLASSSRGEWKKNKENEKSTEKEENNKAGNVFFEIPKVNSQKSSDKSLNTGRKKLKKYEKKEEKKENAEIKPKNLKKLKNNPKKTQKSSKIPEKKEIDIKDEFLTHTLKVKHEENSPKTLHQSRKEEIAERILVSYDQTPTNPRRSSLALDIIHEKPKLKGKRGSLGDIKPKNSIYSLKSSKTSKNLTLSKKPEKKLEISPVIQPETLIQEDQDSSGKKRNSAVSVRPSFSALRENKEPQDPNKSLVKKSTYGEKSFKSSLSIRTEDLGFEKSWSRSSSLKKNIVIAPVQKKKGKKIRRKKTGSSEEFSEYEDESGESQKSFERPKDPKRETILYELNQLEKLKQFQEKNQENFEDEADPDPSEKEKHENKEASSNSDSENDVSIDFELSELTKSKYFQINKFAFTPQVVFRFSQRIDTSLQSNVNELEIKEYNIDHENFESFIIKKRFGNSANAATASLKPTNKYLEILDLEEYLPIEVFRQKMKEFEKIRKKDKILQSRGVVVEIIKKPKFSFTGLPDVNLGKVKALSERGISDNDIIRSGGSLLVRDSLHSSERLYCRIKDVYQLDKLSGINSNSVDRLMNSLKASVKILDRVAK
jgi:hypothetical protein